MHLFARAAAVALSGAMVLAQAEPATRRFRNLNQTFELDLPADWRQAAPDEVRRLRPVLPEDLHHLPEPRQLYVVGPVDRWLAGDFDGVLLQVIEGDKDWNEFTADIAAAWQRSGAESHMQYELTEQHQGTVGPDRREVIECVRRAVPVAGGRACKSLDVYAPAGGKALILAFRTWESDFQARRPELQRWADGLTYAGNARKASGLADRLWTPLLMGALVGGAFLWLYRRNRRGV